jgi:hypothetical protein
MLDFHAVSSGGGTTLTGISTIAAGGDGQTVAGIPIKPGGYLAYWGGFTTIADTIRELQMLNNDMANPRLGEYFVFGASSALGAKTVKTFLNSQNQRLISMRQNTGGANNLGFYIDEYPNIKPFIPANPFKNRTILSLSAIGALTAITWNTGNAVSPTVPLVAAQYAILGVWANAMTNYGAVRFQHSDFQGFKPGIPIADQTNTAAARAVDPNPTILPEGYQFVAMGDCPVFTATTQGPGLTVDLIAITADSPIITLNLQQINGPGLNA